MGFFCTFISRELPLNSRRRSNACGTKSIGSPCSEVQFEIIRSVLLLTLTLHQDWTKDEFNNQTKRDKIKSMITFQEQASDEHEVNPADMLAVSYNNE